MRAALDQEAADRVTVVGGVGGQALRRRDSGNQVNRGAGVAELTGGDGQDDGPAAPIDQGMDLGRSAATRAAYGLGLSPPFPPAAQRWALAWVKSSISSAGGPPAVASASKRLAKRPWRPSDEQVVERLAPAKTGDASAQRSPLAKRCTIPEITR